MSESRDFDDLPERRLGARIRGTFKVNVIEGTDPVLVQSIDLSASGMRFGTNRPMTLFRELSLSFKLPAAEPERGMIFHCQAVIVSCEKRSRGDGYHVALSFIEVPDEDRQVLNRFLQLARADSLSS